MDPVKESRSKQLKAGLVATLLVALCFTSIPLLPALTLARDSYGLPSERFAPDFRLTDAQGQPVSLNDYHGKYVFLMFGFLGCTDICHSQALLFQEINLLADRPDEIHFLFVTMNPEQDTAERLALYFDGRGDNFTALRDERVTNIQGIAADYRAYFAHDGNPSASEKNIRHPGLYFLIDQEGRLRRTYGATQRDARLVIEDLNKLASISIF